MNTKTVQRPILNKQKKQHQKQNTIVKAITTV